VTILVVEDSPTQLEALRFLLEEAGFAVVAATNGREGLAAAGANRIDVVVSDIVMPEMDGYALCQALRADEALRHIPVILLTSLADPRDVVRGLESGANNFICKPFDAGALLARVRNVLANQEIRKATPSEMGISIFFAGQRFFITADRLQILDLLLSTYENAVTRSAALAQARDELRLLNEQLEARVAERTAELSREAAERQRAQEREAHLNRVLRAIRNVNQLIVRERDRQSLVDQACGLLVETRGYTGAWISLLADDDQAGPVAGIGWGEAFAPFAQLVRRGPAPSCWATARAAADGLAILDPSRDCVGCPLQGAYASRGAIVAALVHDRSPVGFLGIATPAGFVVDDDERALLQEVAGDLAFALHTIAEDERHHETAERFRVSFEASSIGKALTSCDGRFLRVNQALATMLGYGVDELQGRPCAELTHPDDVAGNLGSMDALVADGGTQRFEKRYLRKDGGVIWVDANVAAVRDARGQPRYFVAGFVDITERKRVEENRTALEEQLRMSQKMEAIGSLAGGVAHDFNNLLSVILSYTGFAAEGLAGDDPRREDLDEVRKAAESAVTLTRQLLAFGRKQMLQPVPLSLNAVAAGFEKMLRRIVGEDVDLALVLAPDVGLVRADPGQIEQVLMNLVVNARDAMPTGGKLTIETANVELDAEYAARHVAVTPGPYVQLVVTDTGCGMDEATRARIFEPFFTTKEQGKGTGLGLSTVYGIVKQSGGNVWVYSEVGRGTTLKIYLPRDVSAAGPAARPVATPRRLTGTETILVAEDEAALRHVASRALEAAGYTVLLAADGEEALRVGERHAGGIDLLLTDVVMPRMSGRALAQALAQTRPTLKVLYMSGYTDNAIVHHGVLDPGTRFLGKPFTVADLARRVREVLDDGRAELDVADAADGPPGAPDRAAPDLKPRPMGADDQGR
jgi:PAS domain S-box-containing protein